MSDEVKTPNLDNVFLSQAPHISSPVTTQMLMRNVVIALLPIMAYTVFLYGIPALIRIIISVITTVLCESGFRAMLGKDIRFKDYSSAITGLLLALVMPPTLPIWMLIVSAIFAIVVGKEFFGGLGQNPFNPALIGRAFAFVSFAAPMTTWGVTRQTSFFGGLSGNVFSTLTSSASHLTDVLTGPTPLKSINPVDGINLSAGEIAKALGLDSAADLYLSLLFGNHRGSMGESPAFLIILGLLFLLATKTINWRIPVSMIVSAAVLAFLLGTDPILTVLSGGLLFGAVFMATDYVTSPVTAMGRIIFGAGCGMLTVIMRNFGPNPEGVMFSILIMNAISPFLNRIIPRKYGYAKRGMKK